MCLLGHSGLDLLDPSWLPILKKSSKLFLRHHIHKKGTYIQTENIMPQLPLPQRHQNRTQKGNRGQHVRRRNNNKIKIKE